MPERRAAVVGAGVAGLVCAHRLGAAGLPCDVYERWPGLGGQAATIELDDGARFERYYHYLFTGDQEMIRLFGELGLGGDLKALSGGAAIAIDGRVISFNGALDLLRFDPIPLSARLRMGVAMVRMQFSRKTALDHREITAKDWITTQMGDAAWKGVWEPLMRGKFGERADQIAMSWIWDKIMRRRSIRSGEARREEFIYPRRTFEPLFVELQRRIEGGGGRVLIDRPAHSLTRRADGRIDLQGSAPDSFRRGLDPRRFDPAGPPVAYDAVVACVANDTFGALLDPGLAAEVGPAYLEKLETVEYFAALNLVLELDHSLTDYFWINVADRRCPFVGLIEHSNLVGTETTNGRIISHITNYLPAGHELLDLSPDELLERYEPGLRILNPDFRLDQVRNRWMFCEPAAQPIVGVDYSARITPRATGAAGLWLVNTTQIFPEDRGTNFAVRDGGLVAEEVLAALGAGSAA